MGDEFGGIGSTVIMLVAFITIGGASTIWLMGFASRRAAERRRRQFEDEEPLPTIFEQANRWVSGEDATMQEPPPPADDFPQMNPEQELPQPDLDFLTRGRGLPTPDIDEIIRDVPRGYSEGQPEPQPDFNEAREGEVFSQTHEEPLQSPNTDDTNDDDWEAAPEPAQSAPANKPTGATARIDYRPNSNVLPEDAIEVLRVYRDLSDGKLIFHMKDRIFASMQEINTSPLSGRFSAIVDEMVTVEGSHRQLSAPPPPPPPPARPAPPPPPPRESQPQSAKKQDNAPDEDAPEPTIADQIQGFLQQRLGLHPEFANKSIHIRPSIDGTVTIEVEGRFYEAVADIPDDEVRAFLQKTVQEWSDRH